MNAWKTTSQKLLCDLKFGDLLYKKPPYLLFNPCTVELNFKERELILKPDYISVVIKNPFLDFIFY